MIKIGKEVKIHSTARIDVKRGYIGDRTVIEEGVIIEGSCVEIGAESWIGEYASIGGGSCHDKESFLKTGDWFHLGPYAHINTARGVTLGHEVGIGWRSSIFTHGAYESILEGFPVQWEGVHIGDKVWLPNVWINPGVRIGSNIVVSAMSLINRNLPNGCLAGGVPAKILQEDAYPRKLSNEERHKVLRDILSQAINICYKDGNTPYTMIEGGYIIIIEGDRRIIFDTANHTIIGIVTPFSEVLKNQLRRNGIRFRYTAKEGEYVKWEEA